MTSIITASAEVSTCQPANYAIIFDSFFSPHTYTPSLCKAAPQAAATRSVLERRSPFFCPLPGGQQLSTLFPAMPRHCTVMLLLNRHMARGCFSSFVHLTFVGTTAEGSCLWSSILTFRLHGLRAPWPRGVTSCPGHGCTLQDWDWSWGHCQGRRGRLIYPCLKVPTTRKFLLISVQGPFICQRVCFDRGLLPRQPELVSCAGKRIQKRTLKCECSNTPGSPNPTVHCLLVFTPTASVGTQSVAIAVCRKTLA